MSKETITKGLLIRLEALPGKEDEVRHFLEKGPSRDNQEPATVHWSGFRIGESSTFGIFEVFPDEAGREAHFAGQYADELMAAGGDIFAEPTIEEVDLVSTKLPG